MSRLHPLCWFAVPALALLMALPAHAQYRRNSGGGAQAAHPTTVKGTVVAANGGQIQMINASGQAFGVVVTTQTQLSVTGTAEPDYLKPGLFVEFTAEVAKGGAVADEIDHLTLISQTADRLFGFSTDDAAPEPKKSKGDKAADGGADASAKGHGTHAKKGDDPLADPLATKPSKPHGNLPQFPGTFTVRGKLTSCKNGQIVVVTGHGPPVKAKVSDTATIDVDQADLRGVQRGDSISVSGPGRANMVMAETVKIELANPLSGKKAAGHASKTPATHGKPKKDADADLPGG